MSRPAVREALKRLDRGRPGRGASGRRDHRPRLPPPRRTRPAPPPAHPRRASSTCPSSAASWRPGCTTARRSPSWPPSGAARSWPDYSTTRCASLADEDDPVEQQRHALTFWDHIVDGADSIAFRLMYNTLRATYEPALPALAAVMADEVGRPQAYRELAEAISAGDPARGRDRPRRSYSNPRPRPCWLPSTNLEDQPMTATTSAQRTPRKGFTLGRRAAGILEAPLAVDDRRHLRRRADGADHRRRLADHRRGRARW